MDETRFWQKKIRKLFHSLEGSFRGQRSLDEPLSKHCTLQVGGPADLFLIPKDKEDVKCAIQSFHHYNIPYRVIGKGSNLLISDKGFRGAVLAIKDGLSSFSISGDIVQVEAGVMLPKLSLECVKAGLEGLGSLGGIPGTLGGSIVMNAGAYEVEIFKYVESVEVIRDGEVKILLSEDINVSYRNTDLKNDVVLGATLRLSKCRDIDAALRTRRDHLAKRRETQPLKIPNGGSTFKNPLNHSAGQLIEACGLKGMQVGGAQISQKHANFFVNHDSASAIDFLDLIRKVQGKVFQAFGLELELEWELVGWSSQEEK